MRTKPRWPSAVIGVAAMVSLLLISNSAVGAGADPFQQTYAAMGTASTNIADKLVPYAFRLVGILFLIQFALRNYKSVFQVADIKQFLAKLVFPLIWLGFLIYLIGNNFNLLNAIFSSFQSLAGIAAGGIDMSPGKIMKVGIQLQNNLVSAYNTATGANDGFLSAIKYFLPSLMMTAACLMIMLSFFIIALAVAIASLEFYMIVAAAPIAFAVGGLEALKQSSIAPLQTMLSIGYRILILGVIVGVIRGQVPIWDASFNTVTANDWTPIWVVVFGGLLGAVAAFSAGKIAGALASGQSNISGNEAMFAGLQMMQTVATTMTAAATAAQAAGGAANAAGHAGAAAGQQYAKLEDFMSGGTGSISNSGSSSTPTPGAMSPADAGTALLGPSHGFPWTGYSDDPKAPDNDAPRSGNASDAGIGGPAGDSSGGSTSGSQSGTKGGDQPVTSEDRVARALDNMSKSLAGQQPSAGSQLGRAAMSHVSGMQHDSGHVQVHVDPNSRE